MEKETVLCLGVYAVYLCRHEGACCMVGWDIFVERLVYEQLIVYFGATDKRQRLFDTVGFLPVGAAVVVGVEKSGVCVFFEADRGNLCGVYCELGAKWLPAACRQFSRVVLYDLRGTLISLSHFCLIAVGLLQFHRLWVFEIVDALGTIALDGEVEGLDAREALSSLFGLGMLIDHEGYGVWERRAIGVLVRDDLIVEQVFGFVGAATRVVQFWRLGEGFLCETVEREFDVAFVGKPDKDLDGIAVCVRLVLDSVLEGLRCLF